MSLFCNNTVEKRKQRVNLPCLNPFLLQKCWELVTLELFKKDNVAAETVLLTRLNSPETEYRSRG